MDIQEIITTPHLRARAAGVAAILLGPICCWCGIQAGAASNRGTGFGQYSLTPFYVFGFLYGIVLLITLGLGILGLIKSRQADAPPEAKDISISGLMLTLFGLGFLLLIWGSFLVLPCGVFGC